MSASPAWWQPLGIAAAAVALLLAAPALAVGSPIGRAAQTKTLTVTIQDAGDAPDATGWGRVTSRPAGIDCPGSCSAAFARGSSVELTVRPAAGYAFEQWAFTNNGSEGCQGSRDATCTLTIRADNDFAPQITALLKPGAQLFAAPAGAGSLTISPGDPGGSGDPCELERPPLSGLPSECRPRVPKGARVTITAVPDPGARFAGWSDFNCSPASTVCTLPVRGERFVTARFDPMSLTLRRGAFGDVTVTPPGFVCTLTPDDCQLSYKPLTVVTLRRSQPADDPDQGFWIGSCTGTGETCTLRILKDEWVRGGDDPGSTPTPIGSGLRIVRGGNKRGRITGGAVAGGKSYNCGATCFRSGFAYGDRVRLKAKPFKKARFKRWSDDRMGRNRIVAAGYVTRLKAIFGKKRR
jgi:hypothetical protein